MMISFSTRVEHYPQLKSPMDLAKKRAEEQEPEGLVIWADEILKAVGRHGRTWSANKGGMWISLILRPSLPVHEGPRLNYLASWTLLQTLKPYFQDREEKPTLKWPNDIVVGKKNQKLAGILTWAHGKKDLEYLIWGIGVNISNALPESFEYHGVHKREDLATRLCDWNGDAKVEKLLFEFLNQLEEEYGKWQDPDFLTSRIQDLAENCSTLGQWVRLYINEEDYMEGIARRMDPYTGQLVIERDGKEKAYFAGDCFHLREPE
ncbi:MAG: biotin--[acetyl-CoA-carboxylase] ligase [Planctomycetota bacterium]|nr:MAG: biotin--[acetyl-CoA-carboxylase] ligase [Planctomycetota bacterium]